MTIPVPTLPERYLLDLRSDCNLACPMCLLHGTGSDTPDREAAIGKMSPETAAPILDEIKEASPLIQPAMWGEPTLARDFREHIAAMKSRGIAVAINTNGLTLRVPMMQFLVEQKVDAIFFSIDAYTRETLKKVRGISLLGKIENALGTMLIIREEMNSILPRIGATFTVQPENAHELDLFIDHWIQTVDVVRIGAVFRDGALEIDEPPGRQPCQMLYETMPIHANGDVSLCCFDSHKRAIVGNVLTDGGVKAVWHGEKLSEVRRHHEAGDFHKVPFCKDCNAWSGRHYTEERGVRNGIPVLIRRSAQFTYYNRIDRLASWHDQMRTHKPPPRVE